MQEISVRKQAVTLAFENNYMEVVRETLGKSIVRWTAGSGRLVAALSVLSSSRRDAQEDGCSPVQEISLDSSLVIW